jgi:putative ABC transport system substrate-binding protein
MSQKIFVWPLATLLLITVSFAEAQQSTKVPRIGFLGLATKPSLLEEAFLQALRDLGYINGQSVIIEYRWAAGKTDRLPALAEELVRLKVDVLVGGATPVIQTLKSATKTIPIVMLTAADPVGTGFVESLARPGGNITGMAAISPELAGKDWNCSGKFCPRSLGSRFWLTAAIRRTSCS